MHYAYQSYHNAYRGCISAEKIFGSSYFGEPLSRSPCVTTARKSADACRRCFGGPMPPEKFPGSSYFGESLSRSPCVTTGSKSADACRRFFRGSSARGKISGSSYFGEALARSPCVTTPTNSADARRRFFVVPVTLVNAVCRGPCVMTAVACCLTDFSALINAILWYD